MFILYESLDFYIGKSSIPFQYLINPFQVSLALGWRHRRYANLIHIK